MNHQVKLTEQAEADLQAIYDHIAYTLHAVTNANRQLERLQKEILSLAQFPSRFRRYEREPWRSRGLRVMGVDRYLVFYIPDEVQHIVTVLRVMYGGRDIDTQLSRFTK